VEIGAYVAGTNSDADRALALWPRINEFLRQDVDVRVPAEQSWQELHNLLHEGNDW
jgi:flagellum-specific ATP synthase